MVGFRSRGQHRMQLAPRLAIDACRWHTVTESRPQVWPVINHTSRQRRNVTYYQFSSLPHLFIRYLLTPIGFLLVIWPDLQGIRQNNYLFLKDLDTMTVAAYQETNRASSWAPGTRLGLWVWISTVLDAREVCAPCKRSWGLMSRCYLAGQFRSVPRRSLSCSEIPADSLIVPGYLL